MLGYGVGEMSLTTERSVTALETGLMNAMAAVGGRTALSVRSGPARRFELAIRSDARLTNTAADAVGVMVGAAGQTHRVRMMLEGSGVMPLRLGRGAEAEVGGGASLRRRRRRDRRGGLRPAAGARLRVRAAVAGGRRARAAGPSGHPVRGMGFQRCGCLHPVRGRARGCRCGSVRAGARPKAACSRCGDARTPQIW